MLMKRPADASPGSQLALIICAVLVISSASSHLAVRWLKIKWSPKIYQVFGPQTGKPVAEIFASSTGLDGLNWSRIGETLGNKIENWGIAASSPSEWEINQRGTSRTRTFIAVSAFDLNEYFLCDFRAEIVPLPAAIQDLWEHRTDWSLSKRILNQYPMALVRIFFPTAGRSDGVMVGIRRELQILLKYPIGADAADAPTLGDTQAPVKEEKVSDWTPAHVQRRMLALRSQCQGRHTFDGPKKRSLLRMIQRAHETGTVTIVVMPMSPIYQNEFLTPAVRRDFEKTLDDIQRACSPPPLVRLDHVPLLNNNDCFYDFIHLNIHGQQIATSALLEQLIAP